jgi:sorbitol/mannitol transport system permease protein
MSSVVAMVAWEWTPFATLILLTGLQSLPEEQVEAARIDGAGPLAVFRHITVPHLRQFLRLIVVMETIFVIQVFGEIYTATGGGPGTATSTIPYLLYSKAFLEYDIGLASAAGVVAVIAVNLMAAAMMRLVEAR